MRFQRVILSVSLLVIATLAHPSDAAAQLDPGYFDIHYHYGTSGGGTARGAGSNDQNAAGAHSAANKRSPMGVIFVPPRGEGEPVYEEEWVLWDGEPLSALPRFTTIEIVPRESAEPPPLPQRSAARAEPRRVRARAIEYDPGSYRDSCPGAEPAEPEGAEAACHVTEIWQREGRGKGASAPMKRVGSIQSTPGAGGEGGRQEWLLSPEYIYPSPSNGVVTQLRPTSAACSPFASSPERPIARSICVDLSPETEMRELDLTAAGDPSVEQAAPDLACEIAATPWAPEPGRRSPLVLSFLGAALALWCRRRDRQG